MVIIFLVIFYNHYFFVVGNDFLTKFQASLCPSPLLENITLIDTPGVLSGEKQKLGRSYSIIIKLRLLVLDFQEIVRWFAARCDMVILCFDAHKLDISDEFADTIAVLKGNEEKIRIVLNKSDSITQQELMRVYFVFAYKIFITFSFSNFPFPSYGALMWSLGKVLTTPEVSRVHISSFWEKPFQNKTLEALFISERDDLINVLCFKLLLFTFFFFLFKIGFVRTSSFQYNSKT